MDWFFWGIMFLYMIVPFIIGIYAERLVFNVFAWAFIQNMRKGSKKGLAFIFFRNGQHEHRLIDFGKNIFDTQDRTYAIVSARAGKLFNLPILVYPEDHALPADVKDGFDKGTITADNLPENQKPLDLSKGDILTTDDPKNVQAHVKLAILYMMTQQIKEFARFQKLLLIFTGVACAAALLGVVLLWGQGGGINAISGKVDLVLSALNVSVGG